jgi:hypothetical protein
MVERDGKGMVAFRLAPDVRAAVDEYCIQHGVTLSELYRSLTDGFLSGTIAPGGPEGYKQARATAVQLAQVLLAQAAETMPDSFDEAVARYGLGLSG